MNTRFYNALVLFYDPDTDAWRTEGPCELHVLQDRISYIGSMQEQEAADGRQMGGTSPVFDREIDCEGNLLMPGFKNAHAHGPMTFLRSKADDLSLNEWLHKQVFPAEARLSLEDTVWLHKLAILEYLSSGMTASFEMYFIDEGICQAAKELQFRTVLCGAAVGEELTWLDRLTEYIKKYSTVSGEPDPLITFQLGFHAEYSTGLRLLQGIAGLAQEYRLPVFTHCQETEKETLECIGRYHKTPVQFLSGLGMFDHGGGLFHGVWPMEQDMECMRNHHISVITNPGSNTKLASGIAPLTEYEKAGILLGIGTDGPASNNCLDMFWELHLASALQKVANRQAMAMPAEKVLTMATVNNARIMGLTQSDVLEVGKKADLIMLDLHQPNMQPQNHLIKNIVYSGSKTNVALTMVNGNILYEKGSFAPFIDVEEIYQRANEIARQKA